MELKKLEVTLNIFFSFLICKLNFNLKFKFKIKFKLKNFPIQIEIEKCQYLNYWNKKKFQKFKLKKNFFKNYEYNL